MKKHTITITAKEVKDSSDEIIEEINNSPLYIVSNCFRFTYHSCDKELFVELEAENLNKAMIEFATYYHQIDEVYEIVKV